MPKSDIPEYFSKYTVYFTRKYDANIQNYASERGVDVYDAIRELVMLGLKVAEKRRQRLAERKADLERVMGL